MEPRKRVIPNAVTARFELALAGQLGSEKALHGLVRGTPLGITPATYRRHKVGDCQALGMAEGEATPAVPSGELRVPCVAEASLPWETL